MPTEAPPSPRGQPAGLARRVRAATVVLVALLAPIAVSCGGGGDDGVGLNLRPGRATPTAPTGPPPPPTASDVETLVDLLTTRLFPEAASLSEQLQLLAGRGITCPAPCTRNLDPQSVWHAVVDQCAATAGEGFAAVLPEYWPAPLRTINDAMVAACGRMAAYDASNGFPTDRATREALASAANGPLAASLAAPYPATADELRRSITR